MFEQVLVRHWTLHPPPSLLLHLHSVIQALQFQLGEVVGVARWRERFGDLGISTDSIQSESMTYIIRYTVEPLNKGHFGANSFVPCREVVPISEVYKIIHQSISMVPQQVSFVERLSLYLRGSLIRGSTVDIYYRDNLVTNT